MNFHSINWIYAGVLAIALIAVIYAWSDKRRRKSLSEFASAKLLPTLSQTVSPTKIILKKILFALGVFAIFVAIARPQWGYRWEETKSKGIDIIFAIDTSKSMLAEDVKPSRLDRAKLSVLDLLNVLDGDRIGIVAFSGQAFLQCPLTLDYDAFRMSLEALDTNVIQRGGTNIASAIDEAEIAFSNTSNKKVIVLISDGEELEASALDKAKQASKNDVIIYTLGVGGIKGEPIPIRDTSGRLTQLRDDNGKIVTSKLNEKVLSEIAKITGGFYEPLTANGMDTIYEDGLKKIPQHELSARMKQLAIERFQIPLAIAIILIALESLIGTRKFFARKRKTSSIAPLLIFALLPAFVIAPQGIRAETAPQQEQPKAEKIEQANAPVKEEKSEEPKINLPENPTPQDYFNAALDLSANGDKQKAKEFFETAMKMSPEDFPLHAKAFYNIGNIDYNGSKHSLATAETAEDIGKKVEQTDNTINMATPQIHSQGSQMLAIGNALLKQEQDALAKAKSEDEKKKVMQSSPLNDQQFQQQLKQNIAMCETLEKNVEELKKSSAKNLSSWENASKILNSAIGNYKSALSLNPDFSDAKNNLSFAIDAQKNLKKQIDQNKNIADALSSETLKQKLTNLTQLKEKLKKLVRDENNQNQNQQNQENQQNQDQQNNQQNQNQNQQDKQNQNQDNQDKNNQDKQDSQDKQDNKQDKNQEQQKNQQDKQDQNSNDKKDGSQNDKRDEQAVENKRQDQQRDEQQKDSQSGKEKQESAQDKKEKQGEQPQEMPVEQKKGDKQNQAVAQDEKAEKQNENFRSAVGAMTKGEAKQLLESMKDSDKILPLRGFGEQKDRFEKSYKDW